MEAGGFGTIKKPPQKEKIIVHKDVKLSKKEKKKRKNKKRR